MTKTETADPSAIFAEIKSYPPLMREEVQRPYIGREVEWRLAFSGGSIREGQASLCFFIRQEFGMVVGDVPLARYPWLKSLPSDETVRIGGRIRKIDPSTIHLDISRLTHEGRGTRKTDKGVRVLSRTVR